MRPALLASALLLLAAADDVYPPKILFSVRTVRSSEAGKTKTYIEPIALVGAGEYGHDRIEFSKPPSEKELIEKYFRPGTKYNIVRGSVDAGLVTILPSAKNNTCQAVPRLVRRIGWQEPPGWSGADAIAVSSLETPPHNSLPRTPTPNENRELLAMASRLFGVKAVPSSLLDRIKEENVVAIDLDFDGGIDFIGTFTVSDSRLRYTLFAVVMRDEGGALRADVVRFNRTPVAGGDMTARSWTLVDVEDFDDDGTEEIIVANHGYQDTWYEILKRRNTMEWEVVYSGGGSSKCYM